MFYVLLEVPEHVDDSIVDPIQETEHKLQFCTELFGPVNPLMTNKLTN